MRQRRFLRRVYLRIVKELQYGARNASNVVNHP
jgi:hypothetical protein